MRRIITVTILFLSLTVVGQKGLTSFGMQYKPIIPNRLIGTFEQEFDDLPFESSIKQKFGNVFGMVVRHGFTKNFAAETGINFTQRNFNLFFDVQDSAYSGKNDVRLVSYSIPLSGLVFIRLGEQIYMNASIGAALTLFPSDVSVTTGIDDTPDYFLMEGIYNSKVQGAFLSNLGFEYRTKRSGYFYLGASYHLPFAPITTFAMAYEHSMGDNVAIDRVRGSYLTIDLRYFFNAGKEKKFGEKED